MKKILSLLLLLSIVFNAQSQALDTTLAYEWKNNAWQPFMRSIYTNNAQCQAATVLTQNLAAGTSQWVNASLTTNTYTATKKLAQSVTQSWTGGAWKNLLRITYSYNENDQMDSMLTENAPLGTTFQNTYLSVYGYNPDLTLQTVTTKLWFITDWTDFSRQTYTYNADKTVKEMVTEGWSFVSWTNQARNRYTYDVNKHQVTDTMDSWNAIAWVHDALTKSTYTGNNLTKELIQDWTGSAWINDAQTDFTYNGDGTIAENVSQDWLSNAWVNDSRFTFSYTGCTLPLTLVNFTGTKNHNTVALQWQTTSEINTSHFVVLRSSNGSNFTAVGNVNALNNGSAAKNTYRFADDIAAVKADKIYYKLQMFDKDGKHTESRIITLSITGKVLQVTLQPNPARTYCVVKTNSEKAALAIVNFAGNIVYRQNLNGAGSHTINTSGIAKGVYVVRVVEGTESHSQKLVIE
ncbi:T9SS type A sorting domain-containing protein [Panacibacter sp. DH6]|uniref:T9SS type A sorting domain-containing protein n=1 Tax=Panacibacter microcysteis TaxID=2793269 RepID=A0A931GXQ5_9BACT|nr:T9SS type A sorting domain-containing protein [Panacibacter microcysteis]MBG9376334.1 T9SS type A sorting domain-containing protein [Panacibacter microcysteis]